MNPNDTSAVRWFYIGNGTWITRDSGRYRFSAYRVGSVWGAAIVDLHENAIYLGTGNTVDLAVYDAQKKEDDQWAP